MQNSSTISRFFRVKNPKVRQILLLLADSLTLTFVQCPKESFFKQSYKSIFNKNSSCLATYISTAPTRKADPSMSCSCSLDLALFHTAAQLPFATTRQLTVSYSLASFVPAVPPSSDCWFLRHKLPCPVMLGSSKQISHFLWRRPNNKSFVFF